MNDLNNFAYDLVERINNLVSIIKQLSAENEELRKQVEELSKGGNDE